MTKALLLIAAGVLFSGAAVCTLAGTQSAIAQKLDPLYRSDSAADRFVMPPMSTDADAPHFQRSFQTVDSNMFFASALTRHEVLFSRIAGPNPVRAEDFLRRELRLLPEQNTALATLLSVFRPTSTEPRAAAALPTDAAERDAEILGRLSGAGAGLGAEAARPRPVSLASADQAITSMLEVSSADQARYARELQAISKFYGSLSAGQRRSFDRIWQKAGNIDYGVASHAP